MSRKNETNFSGRRRNTAGKTLPPLNISTTNNNNNNNQLVIKLYIIGNQLYFILNLRLMHNTEYEFIQLLIF